MKSTINIYSIKDTASGVFMSPFTSVNNDTAKRNYKKVLESCDFGEDLDLYTLGKFDVETGELKDCKVELVCTGSSFLGGE